MFDPKRDHTSEMSLSKFFMEIKANCLLSLRSSDLSKEERRALT